MPVQAVLRLRRAVRRVLHRTTDTTATTAARQAEAAHQRARPHQRPNSRQSTQPPSSAGSAGFPAATDPTYPSSSSSSAASASATFSRADNGARQAQRGTPAVAIRDDLVLLTSTSYNSVILRMHSHYLSLTSHGRLVGRDVVDGVVGAVSTRRDGYACLPKPCLHNRTRSIAPASPPRPAPPTPRWSRSPKLRRSRSRLPQLWLGPRQTEAARPPPHRPAAHAVNTACSSHCQQRWRLVGYSLVAGSASPRLHASGVGTYCPRIDGPPVASMRHAMRRATASSLVQPACWQLQTCNSRIDGAHCRLCSGRLIPSGPNYSRELRTFLPRCCSAPAARLDYSNTLQPRDEAHYTGYKSRRRRSASATPRRQA